MGRAGAALARIGSVFAALLLGACASLPGSVPRPVSVARVDVDATPLATIAARSAPLRFDDASGFRLLPAGDQALDARLALARRAAKTLDVQYYLLTPDDAGLLLLRELRDAAARGVRVRVLIDDLHAAGADALLEGLAAQPGVEVRLFNPLPVRGASVGARVVLSLHEFGRINRRMHNKLFVADNAFAVTGGRNVADEYFGRSEATNFIDMDLLASGPVVRELSAVFDRFWNSPHAYPVRSLMRRPVDADAARRRFDDAVRDLGAAPSVEAVDSLGHGRIADELAEGRVEQRFARARVLADAPDKVDRGRGLAGVDDDETEDDPVTVTRDTLELIGSAREEVLVASPYFVPDATGLETLRDAVARGVRVTVMTNSFSTTDEPLVHAGYARYRPELLKMGVALYELMPIDRDRPVEATLGEHRSLGRLHAKLAVVDGRFLFVGSMNMDRRSARWNTEVGLVIDSPALAGEVGALLQRERLPGSYRLRLASDARRIEWVARDGAAQVVRRTEPDAPVARRLRIWFRSRFVAEDLL